MMPELLIEIVDFVATVTLNRSHKKNALSLDLINELKTAFENLQKDPLVKIILLKGNGDSFCAGADLEHMRSALTKTKEDNILDSKLMSDMFLAIKQSQKPVVGVVHGNIFGGGIGLVAACDIVVANQNAKFCFSEAKLGLTPSVISPFVLQKMNASCARRCFLTAEIFSAAKACESGLVHEVASDFEIAAVVNNLIDALLKNGPLAMAECKKLIDQNHALKFDDLRMWTAEHIAQIRMSSEAQERMSDFLARSKSK